MAVGVKGGETASGELSGAQIVVESLFALLALGSIVLLGLRTMPGFGSEFRDLALMLDYMVCVLFASKAVWDLWHPDKPVGAMIGFLASVPEIEAFGLRLGLL